MVFLHPGPILPGYFERVTWKYPIISTREPTLSGQRGCRDRERVERERSRPGSSSIRSCSCPCGLRPSGEESRASRGLGSFQLQQKGIYSASVCQRIGTLPEPGHGTIMKRSGLPRVAHILRASSVLSWEIKIS